MFSHKLVLATGPMTLVGAFAVCLMQQNPEATFAIAPNVILAASLIPCTSIIVASLFALAEQSFAPVLLTTGGVLSSYWYLRFIKVIDGRRGDKSIGMSFAIMFPRIIRPLGEFLANQTLRIISITINRLRQPKDDYSQVDVEGSHHGTNHLFAHEIERRRQLALQLLNEKMLRRQDDKSSKVEHPGLESLQPIGIIPNLGLVTDGGRPMMVNQQA